MPTETVQPQQVSNFQVADEDERRMRQVVKGIEQKAHEGEPTEIEGYVATKGVDRAGDFFTEDALKEMAEQIQEEVERENADVKVVFPEFDEEDLRQIKQNYANNGNVDHYNNPGYPMGDPRIVSAYKITSAEYDGFGVKIEGELNEDLPFGVPEAIKAGLQEGYLDGFSVEFIAKKARKVVKEGQKVRKILLSKFTGASLTGRPIQSNAAVTDAEFKSMVGEMVEDQEGKAKHGDKMENKAEKASVKYRGTRNGKLDEARIDKEENNLSDHYLFGEGEDKEDFTYPVVDADGYLRRGNVEAAYGLGARGGVSEDELDSKLEKLNDEFEDPPIDPENFEESQENKSFINGVEELEDERTAWQELKNNITGDTMPDDEEPETDPEDGQDQDDVEDQESKSAAEELRDELSEVRQEIKSVVEENKELREEKEEMEQKFDDLDEDLEGLQEVKSEIDELKQEIKNVTPDNAPEQDTDQTRDDQVSEQESKSNLEKQLEGYSNPRRVVEDQNMKSAIAEHHGVTESEVEEKAKELAA